MENNNITIYEFDNFSYWTGNTKVIGLEDGVGEWWTRSQPTFLPGPNEYMKLDSLVWVITDLPRPVIVPSELPVTVPVETAPEVI